MDRQQIAAETCTHSAWATHVMDNIKSLRQLLFAVCANNKRPRQNKVNLVIFPKATSHTVGKVDQGRRTSPQIFSIFVLFSFNYLLLLQGPHTACDEFYVPIRMEQPGAAPSVECPGGCCSTAAGSGARQDASHPCKSHQNFS